MSRHISFRTLLLYHDKRAGKKEARAVEAHFSVCRSCKERFLSLQASKEMFGRLPQFKEPEGFDFEFRQRLDAELAKREKAPRYRVVRPAPVMIRVVALVTVMVLLTFSVFRNQIGVVPAVASAQGDVEIYSSKEGRWQDANAGMKLKDGDVIRVGRASQVNIESKRYGILLKEETQVEAIGMERFFSRKGAPSYGLNKGKMLIATKKKFKDSVLKIDSPLAEIEARGTGFLVNVSPSEMNKTWVGVLEGKVNVTSKAKLTRLSSKVSVGAGKTTEILPNAVPTTPRYQLEEEWKEVQEIYRLGEEPQVALLISLTPRRVHELLSPAPLYVSTKGKKAMPKELTMITSKINEAIIAEDRAKHLDAIHSLEELLEKYPDPRYNMQLLFFIASYYYNINAYDESISVLDRIIEEHPDSNLISLALCAKAVILEEELNKPQAVSLYEAILTGYPDSLEAEEAAKGLERLMAP